MKKKIHKFNNDPFMTKPLRKAITHRSRLKSIFNKSRTPKTRDSYKKQRNFCVNVLRKTKKRVILTNHINSEIEQNEFPNELKLADVFPIYKKKKINKEIIGL